MKIAILGTTGMLGGMVAEYFYLNYYPGDLTYFSRTVDPKRWQGIKKIELDKDWKALENLNEYDYVINCIGVIKQKIDENSKLDKWNAFHINVTLPHFLAYKTDGSNTQVLQIATDCVYLGDEPYALTESTPHSATDWYGKTKSWGEIKSNNFHHIRTSIIGPEQSANHKSLLEWFLHLPPNTEVNGFVNHLWNGTTTLGFAKLCFVVITKGIELPLLHHFVHIDTITKCEMLNAFAKVFGREDIKIKAVEAPMPVYRALTTDHRALNEYLKKEMGYPHKPTFENLLMELKNETKNSSIFRH